jgi:hypothetical protein
MTMYLGENKHISTVNTLISRFITIDLDTIINYNVYFIFI